MRKKGSERHWETNPNGGEQSSRQAVKNREVISNSQLCGICCARHLTCIFSVIPKSWRFLFLFGDEKTVCPAAPN